MPDDPKKEREVLIPEVLPPDQGPFGSGFRRPENKGRRAERAFAPIVAGALIDAIDFVTMGPVGLLMGFVAGFWIGRVYRLPFRHRALIALAAGWYCFLPFRRFIPLATLVGAYVQFREGRD